MVVTDPGMSARETDGGFDGYVAGALPQYTVTRFSPRAASAADLRGLFLESMTLW